MARLATRDPRAHGLALCRDLVTEHFSDVGGEFARRRDAFFACGCRFERVGELRAGREALVGRALQPRVAVRPCCSYSCCSCWSQSAEGVSCLPGRPGRAESSQQLLRPQCPRWLQLRRNQAPSSRPSRPLVLPVPCRSRPYRPPSRFCNSALALPRRRTPTPPPRNPRRRATRTSTCETRTAEQVSGSGSVDSRRVGC